MPEHRAGTPGMFSVLESFLWNDFENEPGSENGPENWQAWVRRRLPDVSPAEAARGFHHAMQLHRTLRSLQAGNSGFRMNDEAIDRKTLNSLIAHYVIQPRLGEDGLLSLVSGSPADPAGILVVIVLQALQSGSWRRFKLCGEPTCRASYYDASKAAAKSWCSMETCGSRNKMRRYRARG